jgi:hypothetical protein
MRILPLKQVKTASNCGWMLCERVLHFQRDTGICGQVLGGVRRANSKVYEGLYDRLNSCVCSIVQVLFPGGVI